MLDANDLTVWLEWQGEAQQLLVLPRIRARNAGEARYRVTVIREGTAGRSDIRQGGTVKLAPGADANLGSVGFNRSPGDACRVEVSLYEGDRLVRKDVFECKR